MVGNAVSGFSGFGAGGDTIHIFDNNDAQVTSVTFGAATTGSTFEWDAEGNSLGLSVNGQNGAFVALSDGNDGGADTNPSLYGPGSDIGSPGYAVPEPTSAALGLVGLAGLLRRRRAN